MYSSSYVLISFVRRGKYLYCFCMKKREEIGKGTGGLAGILYVTAQSL